jgi:hypothetical protein
MLLVIDNQQTQHAETSEEFKKLEQETELRKEGTESVNTWLNKYLSDVGCPKDPIMGVVNTNAKNSLESLSDAMIHFGSTFAPDSLYGTSQSLVLYGTTFGGSRLIIRRY